MLNEDVVHDSQVFHFWAVVGVVEIGRHLVKTLVWEDILGANVQRAYTHVVKDKHSMSSKQIQKFKR